MIDPFQRQPFPAEKDSENASAGGKQRFSQHQWPQERRPASAEGQCSFDPSIPPAVSRRRASSQVGRTLFFFKWTINEIDDKYLSLSIYSDNGDFEEVNMDQAQSGDEFEYVNLRETSANKESESKVSGRRTKSNVKNKSKGKSWKKSS